MECLANQTAHEPDGSDPVRNVQSQTRGPQLGRSPMYASGAKQPSEFGLRDQPNLWSNPCGPPAA